MQSLDITTNIGCVNNCLYCPQREVVSAYAKRSGVLQMSFDTFKTCIDKVPSHVELIFSGCSEPWLNKDCSRMVMYAYQNGHPKIGIYSTLIGMTVPDIEMLESIPLTAFVVHVPSADGRDSIKVDENYLKVFERLRTGKHKPSYLYHGRDIHPRIKPLTEGTAARFFSIPRSTCSPTGVEIPRVRKKKGLLTCNYDENLRCNSLLPNGDVLLCPEDFGMKHTLGNLLTQDYDSLFRGEAFLKIQEGLHVNASEIPCRYCLCSRHANKDFDYFMGLLNTDMRILLSRAAGKLEKRIPLSKILKVFGIKKFLVKTQ